MARKIFAIHGAFSTPTIFNYMKSKIRNHEWQMFDYSDDINDFVQMCENAVAAVQESCHVIGHSMGGLIALYLAGHWNVKSITTIASPLDGLDVSMVQQYMSRSSFIRELSHSSRFIPISLRAVVSSRTR